MPSYAISNVTRRVVYAASGTGPYNFTFEIITATDVAVYRDDTLLTLTTDYTVTINANGTGYITLTAAPTGATQIAIVGSRAIQRTSDFVTGGDFFANTVNDELDSLTIFAQQNAEAVNRALRAPQTDPTSINMTLPRASVRANKTLAFDSNGNPTTGEVIGDNRGNWAAGTAYRKRDIVKDTSNGNVYYANTAHTSSGALPISTNADSAKWDLLVDNAAAGASATAAASSASAASTSASNAASSASAASSSASAASTSASNAASSATAAQNAQTAAEAAYDSFDDRYLGAKAANPSVDNDGNALITGAIYFNTVANEMRVWTGSAWQAQAASPDTLTERSFAATAGQTSYTVTGGYRVGYTYVWVNGVLLDSADIVATNGTTITFNSALALNDEVRILSFKAIGSVAIADISGLQTALDAKASLTGAETLTNKTIALGSNTVSGTLAQFNTAVTDADLASTGANTFTGNQTGSDNNLVRWDLQDYGYVYYNSGTTNALNYENGSHQRWAPNTGAQTLSITNWPPSGNLGELLIEGVNLGAATITWPTINWIKSDGTTTTTFSSNGVTLQSSGTDWVLLWTRDAGTTIYGKIVR